MLPSWDLIQTPLGPSTIPTPWEPAHPAGTHQLCCDTTSVPSRPFSVPSEHFGIHPFNALFLLPDLLAIRSAIRISAELIMNSRGTQSSPLCWESVLWKMDIPSLSETQTSILKCNYPETLHELPGNSNQHDALTCPIYTNTFSV